MILDNFSARMVLHDVVTPKELDSALYTLMGRANVVLVKYKDKVWVQLGPQSEARYVVSDILFYFFGKDNSAATNPKFRNAKLEMYTRA